MFSQPTVCHSPFRGSQPQSIQLRTQHTPHHINHCGVRGQHGTQGGFFPDRLSVCFVYHWYYAARGCSITCKYVSPPSQVEKTKEIRTMNNIYNNSGNVTYNRVGYCSLYFLLPTSICIIKISTPEYLLSVVMFER